MKLISEDGWCAICHKGEVESGKTYCKEHEREWKKKQAEFKKKFEKFRKQFKKRGKPLCPKCGNEMINAYDTIEKRISPYLWECECTPNLKLSIG